VTQASPWIAIVDDDPSVLKALARLLGTRSFKTRTYASAADFLVALADGSPECLIVDLQMPEKTGLELQHHLAHNGLQIPTIVITAHDEPDALRRCVAAGAVAFLAKPLQEASLLAAIDLARNAP
jgi:FixJ family two-component response regulator